MSTVYFVNILLLKKYIIATISSIINFYVNLYLSSNVSWNDDQEKEVHVGGSQDGANGEEDCRDETGIHNSVTKMRDVEEFLRHEWRGDNLRSGSHRRCSLIFTQDVLLYWF